MFNSDFADETNRTVDQLFPEGCKERYVGCFVAQLTYALEFSSSMIAFARLLQQFWPEFEKEATEANKCIGHSGWKDFREIQFQARHGAAPVIETLRDMFTLLQDACPQEGWTTRVVAIFSYLDRLVDEKGDAFSPLHRAFFRLISGWNDEVSHRKLPIDLVLINSYADQPIRYLSKERRFKRDEEGRRHERWRNSRWSLRQDRGVALECWKELDRVRPPVVFEEALEHATRLTPVQDAENDPTTRSDEIFGWIGGVKRRDLEQDFLPKLPPNLKKFMYRRVFNGHFLAGLANTVWCTVQGRGGSGTKKVEFDREWHRCVSSLDIAFARERTRGLIDELLAIYRRLDRELAGGSDEGETRLKISKAQRDRERLRTMMIDHMALLYYPVTAETLAACPDVKQYSETSSEEDLVMTLEYELRVLVARGLAARFYKYSDRAAVKHSGTGIPVAGADDLRYVYVLDTKVSAVLRARAHLEVYSQHKLVAFQPNVYPSQPERVLKPDIAHFKRVRSVVRALVKTTHQELVKRNRDMDKPTYGWPATHDEKAAQDFFADIETYNDKLRAAYALVRGTFSISVIARLAEHEHQENLSKPFDEYRTWTRKLLNSATLISKIRDRLVSRFDDQTDPLPCNHTFLRDEVSWLYNERALVSFLQGRLFDALPLFEQARVMLGTSSSQVIPQSQNATHRRVQLNFALAQIERGNIVIAQEILDRIVTETGQLWSGDTPSAIHWIARGFQALCHHLTNDFTRAKTGYDDVIKEIGQFDHPRAESIFRRHYGDLLRSMAKSRDDQEYKEAITQLRSSEEL
ncbi:MAG: hypothetical protein AAFY31_07760, partial [Pseudomonadota bacterium]